MSVEGKSKLETKLQEDLGEGEEKEVLEEKSEWQIKLQEDAISVGEGEEKEAFEAFFQTSFEHVRVLPPRGREGDLCHIHGRVSFSDELSNSFVTHFNRSADDPDLVRLGDPDNDCLTLTQDSTDRYFDGSASVYVSMHLYEKKVTEEDQKSDQGEEDPDYVDPLSYSPEPDRFEEVHIEGSTVIANVKACEVSRDFLDRTSRVTFLGYHGFKFEVSYSIVLGARVKIEVKLNSDMSLLPECGSEKGEPTQQVMSSPNKRKHDSNYSIYGLIDAYQNLCGDPNPAVMNLYSKCKSESTMVEIGSPIPLHRWIVVAPVKTSHLSIGVALWRADTDCQIAYGIVRFPIMAVEGCSVITNKRTHTRDDAGNVFSVSITFVDD